MGGYVLGVIQEASIIFLRDFTNDNKGERHMTYSQPGYNVSQVLMVVEEPVGDTTRENDVDESERDEALPIINARSIDNRHVFDKAADIAYQKIVNDNQQHRERKTFDVQSWTNRTQGGLRDGDRILLAEIYGAANSVFEFGLGESTYIANHIGVPRYSGVDSDPDWVAMARRGVSPHFRFYFADVGPTKLWGHPQFIYPKATMDYQVAPLVAEPLSFDVYLSDGRWRMGCMLMSFMHAAARGAAYNETVVYVHDCQRKGLHLADEIFHVTYPPKGSILCAYRRFFNTTDQQILNMWLELHLLKGR